MSNRTDAILPADLLPDEVRDELSDIAQAVRQCQASAVDSMLEMGRLLEDARSWLSKRGNGIFKKWIETECGLAESTAKRCMRAFRVFGVRANLARTFEVSAIHVLSAPSCPEQAREEADRYAESGGTISYTLAKELVQKHAPEKEPETLTAMEVIDLIRKSIWQTWLRCPDELRSVVIPKFRGFLDELERTGDLSW